MHGQHNDVSASQLDIKKQGAARLLLLVKCPLLVGGFPPARQIWHANKVYILF